MKKYRYLAFLGATLPLFVDGEFLTKGGITIHKMVSRNMFFSRGGVELQLHGKTYAVGLTTTPFNRPIDIDYLDTFRVRLKPSSFFRFSYAVLSEWDSNKT